MEPFATPVLPPAFSSVQAAASQWAGEHALIKSRIPVAGGDSNKSFILELTTGARCFVKWNSIARFDMFKKEAAGLLALSHAAENYSNNIVVPKTLALGTENQHCFLMLEYIPAGKEDTAYWENLGRGLASLHHGATRNLAGFETDNYIGLTPQRNSWAASWPDFFAHQRLLSQLDLARSQRLTSNDLDTAIHNIVGRIHRILPQLETKHLLHGDLWSGNTMPSNLGEGNAVLYDPAVYYGDFRVDLAMTELFGGFPPRFYAAYREILDPGPEYRPLKDIYNLYHALNHLNIFGAEWYERCLELARTFS